MTIGHCCDHRWPWLGQDFSLVTAGHELLVLGEAVPRGLKCLCPFTEKAAFELRDRIAGRSSDRLYRRASLNSRYLLFMDFLAIIPLLRTATVPRSATTTRRSRS